MLLFVIGNLLVQEPQPWTQYMKFNYPRLKFENLQVEPLHTLITMEI